MIKNLFISRALCGLPTTPRSLNGTLKSHRSNSTGSLSDKSQHSSISISLEQGFNCDSPEGGTIKKKPSLSKSAVKQNNDDCMDGNSSNKAAEVLVAEVFPSKMPFFNLLRKRMK